MGPHHEALDATTPPSRASWGAPLQVDGGTARGARRIQRGVWSGVLIVALLLGGAIVSSAVASYRSVSQHVEALAQGQLERGRWTVELDATAVRQLQVSAARHLGVGVAAALALVIAAFLLHRNAARAAAESSRLHQRHLASLGEMSAVLAHEIRNPLASLKGHAQLLLEQLSAEGRERRRVTRVVREAVRLEILTDQLLEFARSGEIQRAEIAPSALVEEVAAAAGVGRTSLRLDRAPPAWPLDPIRMRQVVTSLLSNAVAASPAGEAVDVAVTEEQGLLVLTVRDRGEGIAPGQERLIFEPFHTTRIHGAGLGLAVVRRIVELHAGTVQVGNHPEGGALFRIAIPRG
jgi:two-component system, NtrC family, sensor histidine kinase HydH